MISNQSKTFFFLLQLTSCSGIPLFATSSIDGRIKIWNTKCHLVRELVFDNTLSGLCFANARGDILVGFQSNLHYVPLLEYLPNQYLQMMLDESISDDRTEYCISFDPLLKFWYDPDRVSSIWLQNSNTLCELDECVVVRIFLFFIFIGF